MCIQPGDTLLRLHRDDWTWHGYIQCGCGEWEVPLEGYGMGGIGYAQFAPRGVPAAVSDGPVARPGAPRH